MKSTLKWYRLVDDDTGVERYVRLVQCQESVRLLFRLRFGSAGLLKDKKRCRMVSDKRCVMCDSRVGRMWLISWWVVGNLREIQLVC